ncbi:MAG: hypothetical protein R3229_08260 [Alphaproteobacteria bacterium]|nr:hypothetical protein [Alphaproteobacteria bacterium]
MATQAAEIVQDQDATIPSAAAVENAGDQRFGTPRFNRRLSDKILAAYNHAYAADEAELANKLRVLLEEAEAKELAHCERPGASVIDKPIRRSSNAVHQAHLWSQFVDAKQGYVSLSIRENSPLEDVEAAYAGMRNSYTRWAVS